MSVTGERLPWRGAEPEAARAPAAGERRLTLIRRRSRGLIKRGTNTRLAPFAVLAAICAAAVVVGVLLEQVVLAQSAFKLAEIRRAIASAQARNQELLLETTELASPARIERYARRRLGMVEPAGYEYVVADLGRLTERVARRRPSPPGNAERYGAAVGEAALP